MAKRKAMSLVGLLLALMLAAGLWAPSKGFAEESKAQNNHFNVVCVLDASGSMNDTDKEKLRLDAIKQFVNLLSDKGNKLGGVVFTSTIAAQEEMLSVASPADREKVINTLASVEAKGDTNIGAALETAINMIEKNGDPNLPSVIVLLSDGKTDLADSGELDKSLEAKGKALQAARDKGIPIYTVCLNNNGSADTAEMKQIADATGGQFSEVKVPEDLEGVFNAFYGLIYGTSAVTLCEETVPESGKLETEFEVPSMGVEEVNIVINGECKGYTVTKPDGSAANPQVYPNNRVTLLKITDTEPGKWKLTTEGAKGDSIKIDMVFNSSLGVEAASDPEEGTINPADPIVCKAYLLENGERVTDASKYTGYTAELKVLNSSNKEVQSIPMKLTGDHFEVSQSLPEVANDYYQFVVHAEGNNLNKDSEVFGHVTVTSKAQSEEEKNNQAPEAVESPVTHDVLIWPFRDNSLSIDLASLFNDPEGEQLTYKVVSSSFMDDDYNVDNNALTITNFSLRTGSLTVRAIDPFGKSCDVEIVVTSHNVGLIALIAIGVGIIIALIVVGILFRIALSKPFRGDITVDAVVEGRRSQQKKIEGRRGRLYLLAFELEPTCLDYRKSYFQAAGGENIILRSNVPIEYGGKKTKDITILAGLPVSITLPDNNVLNVTFTSKAPMGPARGGRRGGPRVQQPPQPPQGPTTRGAGKFGRRKATPTGPQIGGPGRTGAPGRGPIGGPAGGPPPRRTK